MIFKEKELIFLHTPTGNIKLTEFLGIPNENEENKVIPISKRLYLNTGLQWDSKDEYRYHQTLFVLPTLFINKEKIDVLVLGGGDGLGVRDLLKLDDFINSITLVDISKEMLFLAKNNNYFLEINKGSLNNPKVKTINQDAKEYVKQAIKNNKKYDAIILDYPDPSYFEDDPVNELFTAKHYKEISKILKSDGIISIQAMSSIIYPNAYRKIQLELQKASMDLLQVKVNVNSYGNAGIIFAKHKEIKSNNDEKKFMIHKPIPFWTFYDDDSVFQLFSFFKDEYPFYDDKTLNKMSLSETIFIDLFRNFNYLDLIKEREKKY
jgi:spermidine synthase